MNRLQIQAIITGLLLALVPEIGVTAQSTDDPLILDAPTGRFRDLSGESGYACGLRTDGRVICWGDMEYGQGAVPEGTFSHVSTGFNMACGVRQDGQVVCWGDQKAVDRLRRGADLRSQDKEFGTHRYRMTDLGLFHGCGISSGGEILCWGPDPFGETSGISVDMSGSEPRRECRTYDSNSAILGSVRCPDLQGEMTQVSSDGERNCGVRPSGQLVCWGHEEYGELHPPAGAYQAVHLASDHACALGVDGTVRCWGCRFPDEISHFDRGQCADPEGLYVQITGGPGYSCGLREDRTVHCWGDGSWGACDAPPGEFIQIDGRCGIRADGSVTCWGDRDTGEDEGDDEAAATQDGGPPETAGALASPEEAATAYVDAQAGGEMELGTEVVDYTSADLDGDGVDEAIVLYVVLGPTFWKHFIAVLAKRDGVYQIAGEAHVLGMVEGIQAVVGPAIAVTTKTLGPDDPRCCPSVVTESRFVWDGSKLTLE